MADIGVEQQDRIVHLYHAVPERRRGFWSDAGRLAVGLVDMLLTWQERAAARRYLSGLDDRLLADVGLSRSDVSHETSKPFWRP